MNLSHPDELLLQRHLDGELEPTAAAAFQARLVAEPALRQRRDEALAVRAAFAAAASTAVRRPRADFVAGVLAAVRQLPTRLQLQQADVLTGAFTFCRRLLLAAAVLAALGLLWGSGLLVDGGGKSLQASPDDVRHEIERLDAMLQHGELEVPQRGNRGK